MGEFALPTVAVNYDKLQTALQNAIANYEGSTDKDHRGQHVFYGELRAILTLVVGYRSGGYHMEFIRVRDQLTAGTPSGQIAIELLKEFGIAD